MASAIPGAFFRNCLFQFLTSFCFLFVFACLIAFGFSELVWLATCVVLFQGALHWIVDLLSQLLSDVWLPNCFGRRTSFLVSFLAWLPGRMHGSQDVLGMLRLVRLTGVCWKLWGLRFPAHVVDTISFRVFFLAFARRFDFNALLCFVLPFLACACLPC